MPTITEIVANPAAHGFHWSVTNETVYVKALDRTMPACIPVMDDITLFEAAFPGRIVKMSDGSSLRVDSQTRNRAVYGANPNATIEDLKIACAEFLTNARPKGGSRTRIVEKEVKVFVFKGTEYATEAEMEAAASAYYLDQLQKSL